MTCIRSHNPHVLSCVQKHTRAGRKRQLVKAAILPVSLLDVLSCFVLNLFSSAGACL